ncbi:hypothetical protein [Pedococcus bigeumensis]|uniref:Uncharacterized protein n=1 Tax=Pedococcus bigeumensis TaxID=433644 RepID=A0A502CZM3_9MICO|nr:hypothetical protein [Pedococcus bigeumensis]TPG17211.1 hypothetical protein EAH86_10640 [Pedococcus bigeumensis]
MACNDIGTDLPEREVTTATIHHAHAEDVADLHQVCLENPDKASASVNSVWKSLIDAIRGCP